MNDKQLRDHFAGIAMGKLLGLSRKRSGAMELKALCDESGRCASLQISKMAYEQADQMMLWRKGHPFKK